MAVADIHSQDPFHNGKRIHQIGDSVKALPIGDFLAAMIEDCIDVYHNCDPFQHDLSRNSIFNDDRQNVRVIVLGA